jgi:hypothetical protein
LASRPEMLQNVPQEVQFERVLASRSEVLQNVPQDTALEGVNFAL